MIIRTGVNKTLKDEFATIFSRIDETDELLNLTVKNGDPKVVLNKDGRRWKPPGDITGNHYDPFSIRMRLLELMKQAIYQVNIRARLSQLFLLIGHLKETCPIKTCVASAVPITDISVSVI